MSIPILKLGDVLLVSLSQDLTDSQALAFQSQVLREVKRTDAAGIVIDISGLDVVDSFLARVLAETAGMVKLLGTQAVVCGIQPAVALTLVEMGHDTPSVENALDLDHGMEKIRRLIEKGRS